MRPLDAVLSLMTRTGVATLRPLPYDPYSPAGVDGSVDPYAVTSAPLLSGNEIHTDFGVTTITRVQELPDAPDDQVAATIGVMSQYAAEDSADPTVCAQSADALREIGCDPANYADTDACKAVWSYVRARMSFVQDAVTGAAAEAALGHPVIESVTRPRDIATWGVGDCDDYATWGAALLLCLGVPCRFVTVAADGNMPDEYTHVYLCAYPNIDGAVTRVPLDLSHGKTIGWETANNYGKLREWDVSAVAGGVIGGGMLALAAVVGVGLWQAHKRRAA
jgi:transglutaminase-like putative cysteine protease